MRIINFLFGIGLLGYSIYWYLVIRPVETVFRGLNLPQSVVQKFTLVRIEVIILIITAIFQISLALFLRNNKKAQPIIFVTSLVIVTIAYLGAMYFNNLTGKNGRMRSSD